MLATACSFEGFELDASGYRLHRNGQPIHLERIPFELLCLLVERRGELVTREEIIERIWGKGVFIDSENAINTAVRKIRRALKDDADDPRFIVTVPARGYRFVASLDETKTAIEEPAETEAATAKETKRPSRKLRLKVTVSIGGLAIAVAAILVMRHFSLRSPPGSIRMVPKPGLPLPNIPSIAVLPFTNMNGDVQQDYFSDGITNDLITDLSKGPDIFVIDRASTFTYKGKPVRVQDVSRELGVKYVLEGGVEKAGDQVRISVQLVDATTGADLWAERYDRPMKDIFSLQDEIVRRIVTTLNLQLTLWEKYGVLVRKRTDNLEAYDDLLRGVEYGFSSTKQGNEKARQMYEKAIALDPKYADAYAQLAWTYYFDWIFVWSRDPHTLDRVFDLAQQAVALDDSHPMGYILLNRVSLYRRQYEQALSHIHRAIALDPNNARAYFWLGNTLALSGRPAEAIGFAEKAMRLDPRNRDFYLFLVGLAYTEMGRYADAVPAFTRNVASYPNNVPAHHFLIVDYIELGRDEEARAEASEVLRISPQFSVEALDKMAPSKGQTFRNRLFADLRKAGLK